MDERLPEGDPKGQSPEQKPDTQPQTDPLAGGGQSDADWRQDHRFKGENLEDVVKKMYGTVRNQEQVIGKHGQELGEARKSLTTYEQFYNSEYVEVDGKPIHKSIAESRKAAPPPNEPVRTPDLTVEQLEEQLMGMRETDKLAVLTELVTASVQNKLLTREKAFENPLIKNNDAVRQKAYQFEQQGIAPDMAVKLAVGETAMEMMGKSETNPSNIGRVISSINNQDRTFMQPSGRILQPKETQSKLTSDQTAMAVKLGLNPKDVEPYAGR